MRNCGIVAMAAAVAVLAVPIFAAVAGAHDLPTVFPSVVPALPSRLPSPRLHASAVSLGASGLLVGGTWDGVDTDEVVALGPGDRVALAGHLSSARSKTSAALADGRVLIFGGEAGGRYLAEVVVYEPARREARTLPWSLPEGRARMAVATAGDDVFLFGGVGNPGDRGEHVTDEVWRVEPVAGRVETLAARLPSPRFGAAAVWTGTEILVVGGEDANGTLYPDILSFSPRAGAFRTLPFRLPSNEVDRGRSDAAAIWDGQDLYVFGGTSLEAGWPGVVHVSLVSGFARELPMALVPARWAAAAFWAGDRAYIAGGSADGSIAVFQPRLSSPTTSVTTSPAEENWGRAVLTAAGLLLAVGALARVNVWRR